EEQSVAVLVDLHLLAGADPRSILGFRLLVRVEVAGAEWPADGIDVRGEAPDDRLGTRGVRVEVRAGFLGVVPGELPHLVDRLLRGAVHVQLLARLRDVSRELYCAPRSHHTAGTLSLPRRRL